MAYSACLPFSHALIKALYVIMLGTTSCCIARNISMACSGCVPFSYALIKAMAWNFFKAYLGCWLFLISLITAL